MSVHRLTELTVDAHGPGQGQMDSWSAEIKVGLTDRRARHCSSRSVRFELSPGMSGKVIYIQLDDLRELVAALSEPEDPGQRQKQ